MPPILLIIKHFIMKLAHISCYSSIFAGFFVISGRILVKFCFSLVKNIFSFGEEKYSFQRESRLFFVIILASIISPACYFFAKETKVISAGFFVLLS